MLLARHQRHPLAALPAARGAGLLAAGSYGLHMEGRLNCGEYTGLLSVKRCSGGINIVDQWARDDASGRQQWRLAPHPTGVGMSIQVIMPTHPIDCNLRNRRQQLHS